MFLPTRRASGTRVDDERSPGHGDTDGDSPFHLAFVSVACTTIRERRGGILSRGGEKKDGIFVNNRVNI